MRKGLAWICCALVLAVAHVVRAAEPLFVYEGDGLTIHVLTVAEDGGAVTGNLIKGGASYPFTGRGVSAGDVETVKGMFRAGGADYAFTATYREDAKALTFVTDGQTYNLRERAAGGGAPKPNPVEPMPDAGGAKPAKLPDRVKLTTAEFRDINMANVVAYTMLIPEGFEPNGYIEWSNDRTSYPQRKIKVTAADKSQIAFSPAATFSYSEITDIARAESARMGFRSPIPDKQGDAPPKELGAWVVEKVAQTNKAVSKVRLVRDDRDRAAEEGNAAAARASGTANNGIETEVHVVTFTYDMGGVSFTEELNLTYSRLQPSLTRNMNIWYWMLFTNTAVRAPTAKWEQVRPVLYASANSLRAVPQWFTQSQLLIMEQTKRNHAVTMDEIRRRGEYYNQLSDENMAAWKKSQAIDDKKQNERINVINGTADFNGPDGTNVKLPSHYKYYYTDGKGNFVMTNGGEEPGSGWSAVEPVK